MIMKRGHILLLIAACFAGKPAVVNAQVNNMLTLEQCQQLARQNYPQIRERELIRASRDFSVQNAAKGYLPQLGASGQITYQSDVTEIPFKVPGFDIPTVPKTQYKGSATVNQTIYDGGNIQLEKQRRGINADIQDQSLEVQEQVFRSSLPASQIGFP